MALYAEPLALIIVTALFLIPILLRLYRNLVIAFTWPKDKDFTDAWEYTFGRDYPEGW